VDDNIKELKLKIERARTYAKQVFRGRALLVNVLSGGFGVGDYEVEFPEPDVMHVYTCLIGRRMARPTTYRLSFGRQLKWVGTFHTWGLKPSDIVVE
jgi:hypothetical protein